MRNPKLEILDRWLKKNSSLFSVRAEGDDLQVLELYSAKELQLRGASVSEVEERPNSANPLETYVIVLFESGRQIVFSKQGFAFAPDFTNTGPLPLPNQVYCFQDFQNLMSQLRHVAAEADRGREALQILMVLIALLDGARAVGLEVGGETQEAEKILATLERGETLPPPH